MQLKAIFLVSFFLFTSVVSAVEEEACDGCGPNTSESPLSPSLTPSLALDCD